MNFKISFCLLLSLLLSPVCQTFADTPILGESSLDARQMWEFVRQHNPDFPIEIADHYVEVGKIYGIRSDMALCQAIIETGWFRFDDGTAVRPDQHNYCGLGVVKRGTCGLSFDCPRDGVTAQMQHLYAYATKAPLPSGERKLDKRFGLVDRGCSSTWEGLSGRWASNPRYGAQILSLYKSMTAYAGGKKGEKGSSVPTPEEFNESSETPGVINRTRTPENGRDRRRRNKERHDKNIPAAISAGRSVASASAETFTGPVGPVTARYLGIDLSARENASPAVSEAYAAQEDSFNSDAAEGSAGMALAAGLAAENLSASELVITKNEEKQAKKEKKEKKKKEKKSKQPDTPEGALALASGRKIPSNAIRATLVQEPGSPARMVTISAPADTVESVSQPVTRVLKVKRRQR